MDGHLNRKGGENDMAKAVKKGSRGGKGSKSSGGDH